ncbi:5-oxoprolinase subunit PxpA [Marinobacter sp. JSM 1782161]|uniref:5-oxoprolinase subunit PxpA n=1 Tax=Marinobacter sp. JSM 1782161 TaxID=2685906 RepID=UPI001403A98B|nr:5-oxoprolinase subunit PxpA [Marinobacter sp. JSM 1782161]
MDPCGENALKLNCDLGESYGAWQMGNDEAVMPLIDMANVACGFHASDPNIMVRTVQLAARHGVEIGAHPAYFDLYGFGRRSIPHTADEIHALIWYQVGALDGICRAHGQRIAYVKPHGALNNDMMQDPAILEAVMRAVHGYDPDLPLMIPVTRFHDSHRAVAREIGVPLLLEAFADRAYDNDGQLVSRKLEGAVHHDQTRIVDQARSFAERGGVFSVEQQWLDLPADSLCVHGDNPESLAAVKAIREALGQAA